MLAPGTGLGEADLEEDLEEADCRAGPAAGLWSLAAARPDCSLATAQWEACLCCSCSHQACTSGWSLQASHPFSLNDLQA